MNLDDVEKAVAEAIAKDNAGNGSTLSSAHTKGGYPQSPASRRTRLW
jgi:hypothetical protein